MSGVDLNDESLLRCTDSLMLLHDPFYKKPLPAPKKPVEPPKLSLKLPLLQNSPGESTCPSSAMQLSARATMPSSLQLVEQRARPVKKIAHPVKSKYNSASKTRPQTTKTVAFGTVS